MGLRETFEKLATDFAYEILAIVIAAPLDEALEIGRRPPPSTLGSGFIIPAEKRHVRLDALLLTYDLDGVLGSAGYVVLGDLHGRTVADLTLHPGFGPARLKELRRVLEIEGITFPTRPKTAPGGRLVGADAHPRGGPPSVGDAVRATVPTKNVQTRAIAPWYADASQGPIGIPAEKRQLRLGDLDLSTRLWNVLRREGYVVLGDLDGHTLAELTRHRGFGRLCHRELRLLLAKVPAMHPRTPGTQRVERLVGADDHSRGDPVAVAPPAPAPDAHVLPRERLHRSLTIHVPPEKRQTPVDDLPVSVRLYNTLSRNGYVALGDLDGRTFGHLGQHRGFGRACQRDLRDLLLELGIAPTIPTPTKLMVPAFALEYRLDELRLSGRSQKFVKRARFTVLGDLHDKSALDLRGAGPNVIGEFTSMIEAMTLNGPPEPGGLLDHLDGGLASLKERHRQVLLLRFGGTGEAPLTLAEIGRRIDLTPERVRQLQGHALENIPALAGPGFGASLRDLEARVSAEGADVAAELDRSWRAKGPADGTAVPRAWANNGFYLRLLTKLSPSIEAAVFPTGHRPEASP